MKVRNIQFLLSLIFIFGYMAIISNILYIEESDHLNMVRGENSMMGEVKILLGVMTVGVVQILNFWFNDNKKSDSDDSNLKKK